MEWKKTKDSLLHPDVLRSRHGESPHEKTWIKENRVESMPQMLALRRVDWTIVHLFPPQRQHLVPQARIRVNLR